MLILSINSLFKIQNYQNVCLFKKKVVSLHVFIKYNAKIVTNI